MAGSSFFPENGGWCIDKERSRESLVGVGSENRFIAFGIAVVKLTAGQVTQNTKWPAVQISFLKRIGAKVYCIIIHCSLVKNDCKSILNVHRFPILYLNLNFHVGHTRTCEFHH